MARRGTDSQTDRQTHTLPDRETDTHTHTARQGDRHTHTHCQTGRQTQTHCQTGRQTQTNTDYQAYSQLFRARKEYDSGKGMECKQTDCNMEPPTNPVNGINRFYTWEIISLF